jgi:hypothetical protein
VQPLWLGGVCAGAAGVEVEAGVVGTVGGVVVGVAVTTGAAGVLGARVGRPTAAEVVVVFFGKEKSGHVNAGKVKTGAAMVTLANARKEACVKRMFAEQFYFSMELFGVVNGKMRQATRWNEYA